MPNIKEHFNYTVAEWSKHPFTVIIDALPNIESFFDVGANEGGFSHIMKRRYPNVEAYCFEPLKENFLELSKNIKDAVLVNKAVYYGKSKGKLEWRGSNYGACFLSEVDAGEPRIEIGETEICTLEEYPRPDLIKLDVEGAEVNIIENSRRVKNCPNIIVEWHPDIQAIPFFEKHLPNHVVAINLEDKQYLLCLK
jgi:FkbM family methyltransferase